MKKVWVDYFLPVSIYLLATINIKMPSNQGIPMESPHFDKAAFSTKI